MASRDTLMVHGQPAKGTELGKGAFDHPALGDQYAADLLKPVAALCAGE